MALGDGIRRNIASVSAVNAIASVTHSLSSTGGFSPAAVRIFPPAMYPTGSNRMKRTKPRTFTAGLLFFLGTEKSATVLRPFCAR